MSDPSADSTDSVWQKASACSVCSKQLEPISRPQLLPCCHSACRDCIEDNANQLTEASATNTEIPIFKCKLCGQEYKPEECIDNWFQSKYWSKNRRSTNSHICQSCEGENKTAVVKCDTCDWICDECEDGHKKIKVLKSHVLDETTRVSSSAQNTVHLCATHNEELTVYCQMCHSPFCARCILKDHNLHPYQDTKDETKMIMLFDHYKRLNDKMKEKRSLSELILKNYETFEPRLSQQKEECTKKIKDIVQKLQEKVAEMGTNLLEKANNVCQEKEKDFNQKKKELKQLNSSFRYIEEFMSEILRTSDFMDILKAQDLLTSQLNKLLNIPCNQPDFDKSYKVIVTDKIKPDKNFDVVGLMEGIFRQCFRIVTRDEYERPRLNTTNGDDDITIIGGLSGNQANKNRSVATNAQLKSSPAVNAQQSVGSVNRPNILNNSCQNNRTQMFIGNNPMQPQQAFSVSNTRRTSYESTYPSHPNAANSMQSPNMSNTVVSSNQVFNRYPSPIQSLNNYANSVNTNNFMPQTGIATNNQLIYGGNQQFYVTPTAPTTRTTYMTVVNPVQTNQVYTQANHNYSNTSVAYSPSNGSFVIRQPANYSNNVYTTQNNVSNTGTTRPAIVYPIGQTHSALMTQLASPMTNNRQTVTQPIRPTAQQIRMPQQQQQQQQRPIAPRLSQTDTERINAIAQDLQDSANMRSPENVEFSSSISAMISQMLTTRSPTTAGGQNQTVATSTISSTISSTSRRTSSEIPVLHIPDASIEKIIVSVAPPVTSTQPPRSASADSSSCRTVTTAPTNVTEALTTAATNPPSMTTSSSLRSTVTPNAKETVTPSSTQVQTEKPVEEPMIPNPTIDNDDLFSELSSNLSPASLPSVNNNSPEISPVNSNASTPALPPETTTPDENNPEVSSTKEENNENAGSARLGVSTTSINHNGNHNEASVEREEITIDSDSDSYDEEADCVVCTQEYGEFICCSLCPRAYHIECHVPALKTMPNTSFTCTVCKTLTEDNKTPGRTRKVGLSDRQQNICEKVLLNLLCHKKSRKFKSGERDPQCCDLLTIKKRLESKEYTNEIEFIDDFKRMFSRFKNKVDSTREEKLECNTLERYFKKVVHKLMPSFSEALHNNNSINIDSSASSSKRPKH